MNVTGRERRRIRFRVIKLTREAIGKWKAGEITKDEIDDYVMDRLKIDFDVEKIKELVEMIFNIIEILTELFS